ncbi:small nuclear ribonucleoprotein G-like isoform X2 [Paramacrobiotus metropolitanus]|uniref:small nuclear ribonucleoprotein G-like isoform X2 n=1 Tax=Paramacrobiotus metropolitanus TaxID=2943436 RepID=UPI0024458A92|nr:small nuclear ribonucleoprotein G-like isoform X2 [Paramacrobiotus metropolitanus]
MNRARRPELKKYMDKKVLLRLNGGRAVQGILRGYDPFMNLVVDQVVEEGTKGEKHALGMVVVRGNSIVLIEALERIAVPRMEGGY